MREVAIDKLKPNEWNPNKMDEETRESLKESIKQADYLENNPIQVRPKNNNGEYEIIDGEQRWRTARELGHKKIPIEVEELDDLEARRRTVILNKDRGKIDHFQLGKIFYELNQNEMTQEEIGQKFGYSQQDVSAIENIYARLKEFEGTDISVLSNYDKQRIAGVQHTKLRKTLLDAKISGDVQASSLEKKRNILMI